MNQSLTCISSAAILFFCFLYHSPYRMTKAGNGEESSRLIEKRYGSLMEKRLIVGRRKEKMETRNGGVEDTD
ncbi:MAG: hypothetical protein FVQ80_15790 [Planctomycetes bacterium]|nr:hypothetical protein [Planctomycetota bacterium]